MLTTSTMRLRLLLGAAALLGLGTLVTARAAPSPLPLVINTWAFTNATEAAWEVLDAGKGAHSALDAVELGCSTCERLQCDFTVGFGGSADESGETTLDAMIMDGTSMAVGAVSDLRHIKHAITTARLVMERTQHSMLAGLQATQFAMDMGLPVENLTTEDSAAAYKKWKKNKCQPNFRKNVEPDPTTSCGPYHLPSTHSSSSSSSSIGGVAEEPGALRLAAGEGERAAARRLAGQATGQERESQPGLAGEGVAAGAAADGGKWPSQHSHDTIAMAAVDRDGNIAAGCSTNGAIHKVPGRVGDGSVPGGGAYADSEVGACGATGDGDVHLRFLPCYQVVENMRRGMRPRAAAEDAVRRIARRVPSYVGAVFAVDRAGNHGAACYGWQFKYAYRDARSERVVVVVVDPLPPQPPAARGPAADGGDA